jgi:predicted ATPase
MVRPSPLTLGAVEILVRDAFSQKPLDAGFLRGCWTTTGGNPFLLTELIRGLHVRGFEPVSETVEEVGELDLETVSRWIHLRLAGLPPAAAGPGNGGGGAGRRRRCRAGEAAGRRRFGEL